MANYVTVITDEGAALLASVIANQGALTISEMRFSEHDYTGSAQTATAGTFADVFKTASVNSEVTDSTTIKSAASFTNSGITSDHPLYAVGLVGTDGNTTALLCVCTTSDPDYIREPIPISNVSTYGFNINLTVSDTDNITVVGTAALILYSTDVIDNLTSTATNKPLAANQGRVLKGNIDDNFSGQSNENLLDNGWFTVNQRGFTSGNFANNYPADRWTTVYSDISDGTISNDGNGLITMTGASIGASTLYQITTSPELGKTYTLSALIDGAIYKGTVTLNSTSDQITIAISDKATLMLYYSGGKWYAQVSVNSGKTLVLRAVKLEVGSVSTLAHDVAPNITAETIKCQRYFFRQYFSAAAVYAPTANRNATSTYLTFDLPVEMRATPTISYAGTFAIIEGVNVIASTNVSLGLVGRTRVGGSVTCAGGLTPGYASMFSASAGSYIDYDAEL